MAVGGDAQVRVVLGVAGGIAAYKAVEVLRLLAESGHDVTVVPTAAALRFVGEPTWAALSGHRVLTDLWADVADVPHVRLGREADLVLVVPATADLIARAAHGLADDALTNVLLATSAPVVMAPAMHAEMWDHAATRDNVAVLRSRGVLVVEPDNGRLTGADSGRGRLPAPAAIVVVAQSVLARRERGDDLAGRRVVVSAGGTVEPIDPVRRITNRSSGKQGVALAAAALVRGAVVTLVTGEMSVTAPAGVDIIPVETAAQLHEVMSSEAKQAHIVVMTAAVADFRVATVSDVKLKKSERASEQIQELELTRNADILADLVAARLPGQCIVGFAAETGDDDGSGLDHARRKIARKGVDLLVFNDVSGGAVFGDDSTAVVLLSRGGREDHVAGPKIDVAHAVLDAALAAADR